MAMAATATKALRGGGGVAAARKILASGAPSLHPSASSLLTTPQVISRGFSVFGGREYVKTEDLVKMNNRIQSVEACLATHKAGTRAEMEACLETHKARTRVEMEACLETHKARTRAEMEASLETHKVETRTEMLKMKLDMLLNDMSMVSSAGMGVVLGSLIFMAWVKIKY